MKRIVILIAVVIGFWGTVTGQVYYNMWRGNGDAGKPEWIANFALRTHSSGIEFTTANSCRGFVNASGRWGLVSPNTSYTSNIGSFNNIISGINNLTLGVEGWVCTEGLSVRHLDLSVTNTLDILTTGDKSTITSNGDSKGLHINSATGHKIYMYDKVYFDQYYWTSMGPGRNNDPTISNANNNKMMRIASNGGLGFWGISGVETNDNPQFQITGTEIKSGVPMSIKKGNISLLFGTTADDKAGWIGTSTAQGLYWGTNNRSIVYLGLDDNMYVGLEDEDVQKIRQELKAKYRLFVAKGVLAEDYSIAPKSSWADFVFDRNYNLLKISEVATFIQKNNHLPDIPSAKQVAEEGYSQHEMNKVLLQKIEELTLYTIQQQEEIDALKSQLQELNR